MTQVIATFSGVENIKSAVIPRSLGFAPNPMVLICNPQTTPVPPGGTLTVFFNGLGLNIPDVKVDFATQHATTSGHVMVVRLIDRRWRWKFFQVSGRYNAYLADGTIDPATQKSVQQLATILLNAMYEMTFDVSILPTDIYPSVDWNWHNAAVELAGLCEEFGCDISLNWNDTVSVVRLGVGAALPINGDLQDGSVTADPPEAPNKLVLVCGETQFQAKMNLVPVGLDTDGSVKEIGDLSYMPSGGWDNLVDESFFEQMGEEDKTEVEIALAKATVWKWYQVKNFTNTAGNEMYLPGYGTLNDIRQILPINRWRLVTYESAFGTRVVNQSPAIFGQVAISSDVEKDENTDSCTPYEGAFTLDGYNGIVKLTSRAYHWSGDIRRAAILYLEASFGVRDWETGGQVRTFYEYVFSPGVMSEAIFQEDLALSVKTLYEDSDCFLPTGTEDNATDLANTAQTILALHALRYTGAIYGSGKYRGLQPFNTDGTIRQVVVYVDDRKGINTVASYNSEVGPHIMRSAARRRRRIVEQMSNTNRQRYMETKIRERGGAR